MTLNIIHIFYKNKYNMKFNINDLRDWFFDRGKRYILSQVNRILRARFDSAKEELIQEVMNHEVSKELINKTSPSKFLNGQKGSLFAFFGFESGEDPVGELVKFLNRTIRFIPATTLNFRGETKVFMSVPTPEGIAPYFPLSWAPGLSWITSVEEGLDGLDFFVPLQGTGRSSGGIQGNKDRGFGSFDGVGYLTPILEKFKEGVTKV